MLIEQNIEFELRSPGPDLPVGRAVTRSSLEREV